MKVSILFVVLFVISSFGYTKSELIQDMSAFDKTYIPVVFYTKQQKPNKSQNAINELEKSFKNMKKKYRKRELWKPYLGRVQALIEESNELIMKNDLLQAHDKLEEIRMIFLDLRKKEEIDYIQDPLSIYHLTMENIILSAKGKTENTLTDGNIQTIKDNVPKAIKQWENVIAFPINPKLYSIPNEKLELINSLKQREKQKLFTLQNELEKGNKKAIIRSSLGLKATYAKLFKIFGNFR